MKTVIAGMALLLIFVVYTLQVAAQPSAGKQEDGIVPDLEKCNITWHKPGRDLHDAMPAGNGDIGVSMWIERDGDLFFYISKSDAYDENNRLLKPGLIRVNISPNPFASDSFFLQQLLLKQSAISVQTGTGSNLFKLRLWIDANHPVIRLEINSDKKFTATVQLQSWRRQDRVLEELAHSDPYNTGIDGSTPGIPTIQRRDSIIPSPNAITWFHQNKYSCWPFTLALQGLEELSTAQTDPLLNNVFGAVVYGNGLALQDDTTLTNPHPVRKQDIAVIVSGKASTTPSSWLTALHSQKKGIEKLDIEQCRMEHEKWWQRFWDRSYLYIHTSGDTGALLTRSYVLQRYMIACSGRGKGWVKFNGSIFTLPAEHDPDFRRWGSAQWFQNARLLYWPMIRSGDFDVTAPFYATYLAALPLAKKRTNIYYHHAGAFFSETSYAWGTYVNGDYGYNRKGLDPGFVTNPYIRRHWSCGLELIAMMLEQYGITVNKQFLTDTLLPIAIEVTKFYDAHWKRGGNGKILFDPAQALETWQTAINPMPEIAGLTYVLRQLLDLPEQVVSPQQRNAWKKTLNDLPAIPAKTVDGKTVLLPAQWVTESANSENPELYAVFPFRLFGVGKPSLQIARNTYAARVNKESRCWYQDNAQAAYLGLAHEAASGVIKRMTGWNRAYAFPAMWGPGNDELPDLDHGGVGQIALQAMLMQAENNKILLFPAWPGSWDVSFRFPAPHRTMVEGEVKNGKLQKLTVTPASRAKDVVILPMQ